MMYTVKMKGRSVEDAIKSALEVLKIDKEEANITILSEGGGGVLGVFGGRDAEVEVSAKAKPGEAAEKILQEIMDKMGFIAKAYIISTTEDSVSLEIKGDDIALLIGKDGKTLDSLQYLVNIMANNKAENRVRIGIEAGGYRRKQEKKIEKLANEAAEEAIASGKEVTLPPMTAKERRMVHVSLKDLKLVSTHSVGEGPNRSVVITPSKD